MVRSVKVSPHNSHGLRQPSHVLQLEVGAEHFLVQVVAGLLHLLGVVPPVPRPSMKPPPPGRSGPACRRPPPSPRQRGSRLVEQAVHRIRRVRHVLVEHIVGVGREPEQLGALEQAGPSVSGRCDCPAVAVAAHRPDRRDTAARAGRGGCWPAGTGSGSAGAAVNTSGACRAWRLSWRGLHQGRRQVADPASSSMTNS